MTALVPSLTACLASSPGKISRTAVCTSRAEAHQDVHGVLQSCVYTLLHCCCTWISREEMVGFLLRRASLADSVAMRSNWSCNTPCLCHNISLAAWGASDINQANGLKCAAKSGTVDSAEHAR